MTSRQEDVLNFILRHMSEKGYSPTIREIAVGVGLKSSSTAAGHVERLAKQGVINFKPNSSRSITVVKNDEAQVTIMRRRVAIKVLEITEDGLFKRLSIGEQIYVLDSMG